MFYNIGPRDLDKDPAVWLGGASLLAPISIMIRSTNSQVDPLRPYLFVYPQLPKFCLILFPNQKSFNLLMVSRKKMSFFKNGYKYIFVFFNLVSIIFFLAVRIDI